VGLSGLHFGIIADFNHPKCRLFVEPKEPPQVLVLTYSLLKIALITMSKRSAEVAELGEGEGKTKSSSSSSSNAKDTKTSSSSSSNAKDKKTPKEKAKTGIDWIVLCIREQKKAGGSSKIAISKKLTDLHEGEG
jgi:hypothetical protein